LRFVDKWSFCCYNILRNWSCCGDKKDKNGANESAPQKKEKDMSDGVMFIVSISCFGGVFMIMAFIAVWLEHRR